MVTKPPVEDYDTRISKGRGAYYSPPPMTYSLSIVLDPKFKQIMKFNRSKFLTEMEFFDTEGRNNLSSADMKVASTLPQNIYNHAEFFVNSHVLSIINYYYTHDLTSPFPSYGGKYKYLTELLHPDLSIKLLDDARDLLYEYYINVNDLYFDILRSNIINIIYQNISEFPAEKGFFTLNYDNTNIDHRIYTRINVKNYKESSNPVLEHLQISKQFHILDNIQRVLEVYETDVNKTRRIDDNVFGKFSILYMTYMFKNIICQSLVRDSTISFVNMTRVIPGFIMFTGFEIVIDRHSSTVPSEFHEFEPQILKENNILSTRETIDGELVKYKHDINLKNYIYNCQSRYIILGVRIYTHGNVLGHANILIYKPAVKDTRSVNVIHPGEVEIFDPQVSKDSTLVAIYTTLVKDLFPKGTKYINIQLENSKLSLQQMQEAEACTTETGHCATWSLWYAAQRLGHPKLNAKEAHDLIYAKINKLVAEHAGSPGYNPLSALVKNYTDYIWSQRAFILTKSDIPNEFKNWFRKVWKMYPYSQRK